jgi:hypothetical protein
MRAQSSGLLRVRAMSGRRTIGDDASHGGFSPTGVRTASARSSQSTRGGTRAAPAGVLTVQRGYERAEAALAGGLQRRLLRGRICGDPTSFPEHRAFDAAVPSRGAGRVPSARCKLFERRGLRASEQRDRRRPSPHARLLPWAHGARGKSCVGRAFPAGVRISAAAPMPPHRLPNSAPPCRVPGRAMHRRSLKLWHVQSIAPPLSTWPPTGTVLHVRGGRGQRDRAEVAVMVSRVAPWAWSWATPTAWSAEPMSRPVVAVGPTGKTMNEPASRYGRARRQKSVTARFLYPGHGRRGRGHRSASARSHA